VLSVWEVRRLDRRGIPHFAGSVRNDGLLSATTRGGKPRRRKPQEQEKPGARVGGWLGY
jgi:hypothetical protein